LTNPEGTVEVKVTVATESPSPTTEAGLSVTLLTGIELSATTIFTGLVVWWACASAICGEPKKATNAAKHVQARFNFTFIRSAPKARSVRLQARNHTLGKFDSFLKFLCFLVSLDEMDKREYEKEPLGQSRVNRHGSPPKQLPTFFEWTHAVAGKTILSSIYPRR